MTTESIMTKITDWTAVRAGAGITVTGKGAGGEPVKLTRVERIEGGAMGTVAVRGGDRFNLS